MKIAMLAPIAWRTPPRHYGPWELITSLLTEGLVKKGIDVTLFATIDSVTTAKLDAVCPIGYEEAPEIRNHVKVWEGLHIANCFEKANQFDIIHNQFDFLPLTYSRLIKTPVVTTIHGFSSKNIIPVYKKYDKGSYYVSISNSDRSSELTYQGTVYHGIDMSQFKLSRELGKYLLFFGRIHPDKGTKEAIEIAKRFGMKLIIAGIIQDQDYFDHYVKPSLNGDEVVYVGSAEPEKRNKLLREAYALLHPISFAEPFGLSVVEAMACGTPVVAFNKGSMAEIIVEGETGFLVDNIEEAIIKLPLVSSLNRIACRIWVEEKFSQDRMTNDYIKIYEKIIALGLVNS